MLRSIYRINAIESELKQSKTINVQMTKDVNELKQVIYEQRIPYYQTPMDSID
jgi:hypothetical protein